MIGLGSDKKDEFRNRCADFESHAINGCRKNCGADQVSKVSNQKAEKRRRYLFSNWRYNRFNKIAKVTFSQTLTETQGNIFPKAELHVTTR